MGCVSNLVELPIFHLEPASSDWGRCVTRSGEREGRGKKKKTSLVDTASIDGVAWDLLVDSGQNK